MRILRKKKVIGNATIQQDELARRIAKAIIRAQTCLADYLNAKTNSLTSKQKLILYAAFTTLFAAINIYILI